MKNSTAVAALYVVHNGCYYGLPGVEPWGLPDRDARHYNGPWPVIAHPPCKRWGRYWSGGPSAKIRRTLGDDDGCFVAALSAVRKWGGVIEHPEASHAWRFFNIEKPPRNGGWIKADKLGWTCCVEQGHYGHLAKKATWLYVVGIANPPLLIWGPSKAKIRLDRGYHSAAERIAKKRVDLPIKRLSAKERLATPLPFRDLLLSIARDCNMNNLA